VSAPTTTSRSSAGGTLARAWDRFWFTETAYLWLAIARIVMVGFVLFYMFLRNDRGYLRHLQASVDLPALSFDPLPLYEIASFGGRRLGESTLTLLFWTALIAAAFAFVGLFTRVSLFVCAASYAVMQTYLYSFDEYHHPETVLVISLGLLAFSPAGRALSLDALRRVGRSGFWAAAYERSPFAGWPLKAMWVFYALAYFSAGLTKLRTSLDWLNGWTLQFHVGRDGVIHGEAVADWIASHHWAALVLSYGAVAFELGFCTTLLWPKLLRVFVPAGIALHISILLVQHAPFLGFVAGYAALLPFILSGTRQPADPPGERRLRAVPDLEPVS
jgi:hypothetical protein